MIDEPNKRRWRAGDLVVYDADAKRPAMLMAVVGYTRDGRCRTIYVDPMLPREWGRRQHSQRLNSVKVLHDPARFGIDVRDAGIVNPDPEGTS